MSTPVIKSRTRYACYFTKIRNIQKIVILANGFIYDAVADFWGTIHIHVGVVCLNDQGGERMDVTEGKTSTLRAGANHPPLVFENHSQDSRYTGPLDVAQTVLSTFGTGGNNQPFVVETPKTLKIRSGCDGGGKGPLIQDDKSATLGTNNDQTLFQPKVYGICSKTSHSMLSDNPKSGFYEAETTRTLDANGGSPVCNQGGMALDRAIRCGNDNGASVYDTRGILFI